MMAEYNPLHSAEINSGLNVYSYHLKDNFNAIKTATDTKLNKDSATTQTVAGTVIFNQIETSTFSGNPSFNGNPTFSGAPILTNLGLGVTSLTPVADLNAIATAGHVVANDATANKPTATGVYTVTTLAGNNTTSSTQTAVNTAVAGDVWVRQETAGTWGAWRQLSDRQYALGDSIRGAVPTYTSTTSITMGAGLDCADSTRTVRITVPNATVINFATTGLNGLDTGSIASNTWYYIHAILNPTTGATGYVASTSQTSPTMPSGFTVRRLLPLALKTKTGSAALMRFSVTEWGMFPKVRWNDSWNTLWFSGTAAWGVSTTDDTRVLVNGYSLTYIDVSLASFVPFFSREAMIYVAFNESSNGNRSFRIRPKNLTDTNTQGLAFWANAAVEVGSYHAVLPTNSSRECQYFSDSPVNVSINGYIVTEVVG